MKAQQEPTRQWPQFLAVLTASISGLGYGTHLGWLSPSVPKLLAGELPFQVTMGDTSYMAIFGFVAFVIGGPLTTLAADKVGRKPVILFFAVPQIIAWIIIINANSVCSLYIAKLFAGLGGVGVYSAIPMYIGEIADPKIRGVLGSYPTGIIIIGIVLINCYGSAMTIVGAAYWSISIPIAFLMTFIWMPESPYYYLMKQRPEDAKKALQFFRRMKSVDTELNRISSDVQKQLAEPGSFKDVFTIPSNRKALFIVLGLRTLHAFAGNTAFTTYAQYIFQHSGSNYSPAISAIIYNSTQFIVILAGSTLLDKFGRKPVLIGSCIGSFFFLILEGSYFYIIEETKTDMSSFQWFPVLGIMLYVIAYGVGINVGASVMMGELFSFKFKAKAVGIVNMAFAVGACTQFKVFQLLQTFGLHYPFLFFAFCCLTGTLFCYFCVPETKGRTLGEIQQMLKGTYEAETNGTQQKGDVEMTKTRN